MIAAARVLSALNVPFLCDPGQGLTDFTPAQARELVAASRELIVNRYEFETLREHCGGDPSVELDYLVVTAGADGSHCGEIRVPAAPVRRIADPTGCGDAYRTGFVLRPPVRRNRLPDAMRAGACAAAIKIETHGTQRHRFADFRERYAEAWNEEPSWLDAAGTTPA